jgi:hypothetical protein
MCRKRVKMTNKLINSVLIIVCVIAFLALLLKVVLPEIQIAAGPGPKVMCRCNLIGMGLAMKEFTDANERKLPFEPNWCDILHEELFTSLKAFICPGGKTGPCSYALNKNVIGLDEVPSDVVLLFDSKPGWNQVGGPELLAPENHRGRGCNVLFGDFEAKFVERNKLAELNWGIDPLIGN